MTITLKHLVPWLLAVTLTLPAWAGGDGSDGHTHAAPPPLAALPGTTASPRFSAETEQFELVGVLQGKVLTLYLDQFSSNAPVAQAQIEIESGTWKAVATEVSPAVYAVPVDLLAQPGRHPLAITVQAGDEADLMNATLETGPASVAGAGAKPGRFGGPLALWWGAAALALALAGLGLMLMRRHKPRPTHEALQ